MVSDDVEKLRLQFLPGDALVVVDATFNVHTELVEGFLSNQIVRPASGVPDSAL